MPISDLLRERSYKPKKDGKVTWSPPSALNVSGKAMKWRQMTTRMLAMTENECQYSTDGYGGSNDTISASSAATQ